MYNDGFRDWFMRMHTPNEEGEDDVHIARPARTSVDELPENHTRAS